MVMFRILAVFLLQLGVAGLLLAADNPAGRYSGSLNAGVDLPLIIELVEDGAGWRAHMESPSQTDAKIPASSVSVDGATWQFEFAAIGGRFSAELSGGTFTGTWTQGGGSFPLTLSRSQDGDSALTTGLNRPQTPKPPFPYAVENITFSGGHSDVQLAGTITRPEGDIHATVVLVTGSGPQDRDETIFGHKPFLVIADHLSRQGFQLLRYDDRGVGASTGNFSAATSYDFMDDAIAAVRFMREKDADNLPVYLLGHSEGGMIGPAAASELGPDLAGLVLLAAPAVWIPDLMAEQQRLIFSQIIKDPDQLALTLERSKAVTKRMYDADTFPEAVSAVEAWVEGQDNLSDSDLSSIRASLTPWFHAFLKYDVVGPLVALRHPTLALYGNKDFQVPADYNAPGMQSLTDRTYVTVQRFLNVNHLFQRAQTGAVSEYAEIEETFDPTILQVITDWLINEVGDRTEP